MQILCHSHKHRTILIVLALCSILLNIDFSHKHSNNWDICLLHVYMYSHRNIEACACPCETVGGIGKRDHGLPCRVEARCALGSTCPSYYVRQSTCFRDSVSSRQLCQKVLSHVHGMFGGTARHGRMLP